MLKEFLKIEINSYVLFTILVLLVYFDISFFEHLSVFEISLENSSLYIILLIFIILFVFVTISLLSKIKITLSEFHILTVKFDIINYFVYAYNVSLFILLACLIYQVSLEQSYDINLIYLLLILSHLFGLFFSLSGSIKFFQWLKSNKEKLLIMYFISFISFSFLIALSLIYNILYISDAPTKVTPVDFRERLAVSPIFPSMYQFYLYAYIFSFCSIWVSTFILLHDHLKKKFILLLFIMIIPMLLFLINLLPYTVEFIVYLISIYPFLFEFYASLSTITFFMGPILFSLTILLIIRKETNKHFKTYMLPLVYGLFLVFVSTQTNLFSQVLYPPFGLISILFSGLSIYLIFIGIYSSSIFIARNYYIARSFVNRFHEYQFFAGIAKSELESGVRSVLDKLEEGNQLQIQEKETFNEFNKEELGELINFVKKELKSKNIKKE